MLRPSLHYIIARPQQITTSTTMVYLKSPFPPIPAIPDRNVHEILVEPPNGIPPADFTLHIDAVTGKTRTYTQFKRAVELGSTALGAPVADGGLGLSADAGHMVGLYSSNCMVRLPSLAAKAEIFQTRMFRNIPRS